VPRKAESFKRNLKVAGLDSYCAVRRVITPLQFLNGFIGRLRGKPVCAHRMYSGPGMGLLIALPEAFHRDMGVDLRGGQAAVPQDFLDRPQVRAAVKQVRSG
jgi:hypothetical protein